MNNPLLDNEFITTLMEYRQRETYARITLLTKDELPVEYIEGRVTGGSINIDGNSALRRTCNLTLTLKDKTEVNNFQWAFKSKFKLEIGVKNTIDPKYPNIVWFKQGTFILTSCNMNQTVNNYTITVNGKDKMCLLNGDLGGNLTSSVDFGVEEYYDKAADEVTYNKILLKDIIRNVVQTFGGELAENIIINDLDQSGLELLEYRGQTQEGGDLPLYLFRNTNDSSVEYVTLDEESKQVFIDGQGEKVSVVDSNIKYATTSDLFSGNFDTATKVTFNLGDKSYYNIIKLTYGDLAGYRITDLTYAGDLKANVGETLVSVLDKIVKMLSNFEYYYNLDGKFVFQKKRIYISTPWGGQEQDSNNIIDAAINDSYPKINLTNAQLTTAFANNPNLLNVKNDFSVWGTYKSISGVDIPIHMRYALDTKPTYYKNLEGVEYTIDQWDWREIIYQMAVDYYKNANWTKDDFLYQVGQANPAHYPFGKTGYEQYYTDIQGFWRNLYDPDPEATYEEVAAADLPDWNSNDWPSDTYYVDHYYDIIENVGDIDNYDINDLYIITTIDGDIVTAEESQSNTKKVFAPFVGSKACCLYPDSEYYYYTNKEYVATKDAQKLNLRDLTEIYYYKTADQTYDLITTKRKADWIEKNYDIKGDNESLHRFWVKKDERTVLNKTSPKGYCRIIYRDGISNNKNYIQYLTRWDYSDNFGNLANSSNGTPSEVSEKITYYRKNENGEYNSNWWNKAVSEDPSSLIFWFDFLDVEDTDLYKYSVKEIGPRTKAINDSNVKSIYYRDVPNVIFTQDITSEQKQTGYTYIQTPPGYQSLFSVSGRGKSAKERVDELLQEHSYAIEQTTITTVPLYHLEPNTRIYVRDEMSNIDGEYIITKLIIPLTHNGTMSLSTNKVVSNIM